MSKNIEKLHLNEFLNRYYPALAVGIVLFVLFICGATFIYPEYQELMRVRNEQLSTSEVDLIAKADYLEDLEEMEENFDAVNKETLRNLDKVIIAKDEFPYLFARIESLVNDTNMQLLNMSYTSTSSKTPTNKKNKNDEEAGEETVATTEEPLPAGIGKLIINVTIGTDQGTLDNFINLLDTIESNIELIEIKNITYNPGQTSYSLSFEMYYLEEELANNDA
ncbi:MAG: hypothetical protein ABID45_02665 [Patescibacteria group bacterium]